MSAAQQLGKECFKRAQKKYGYAWRFLSQEQQSGAVAMEIVSVVQSQVPNKDNHVLTHLQECATAAYGEFDK